MTEVKEAGQKMDKPEDDKDKGMNKYIIYIYI